MPDLIKPATALRLALACVLSSAGVAGAQDNTQINPHNIPMPAGLYRCDLNRAVLVRQVAPDQTTAVLQWDKKDYTLKAVAARSGALRYEDSTSGLVWLVIVGKSMLLDTKNGKQLANDCKA